MSLQSKRSFSKESEVSSSSEDSEESYENYSETLGYLIESDDFILEDEIACSEETSSTILECSDIPNSKKIRVNENYFWTPEETELLCNLITTFKNDFPDKKLSYSHISSLMGGKRTADECRLRWRNSTQCKYKGSVKGNWKTDEIAKLYEAISKYKELNLVKDSLTKNISWTNVSKLMGNIRTPKQCKKRFTLDLRCGKCNGISINEVPDLTFCEEFFNNPCENCQQENYQIYCETCFKYFCNSCNSSLHDKGVSRSHVRRVIDLEQIVSSSNVVPERRKLSVPKTGDWSDGEVTMKTSINGRKNYEWRGIAYMMEGKRTELQCRNHWASTQKANIRYNVWTKEEESLLENLVQQYKDENQNLKVQWKWVATQMNGNKSNFQCQKHWKVLYKNKCSKDVEDSSNV